MSGDFYGTFENSIHKSRIIIPASFKKKFAPEANMSVIVTIGPSNTIAIYPLDNWNFIIEQLELSDDPDDKELLDDLTEFCMPEQELEDNGRVRLSEELMKIANLKDMAKIKGEVHYMSLWNPEELADIRGQKVSTHKQKFTSSRYQKKRKQ